MPVLALDSVKGLTKQAQQECDQGRLTKDRGARLAYFQKGQALAEQAVTLDERDANAHFVLFCNLGEQLRIDGESVTSVFGFRRMMKELDRALELNPAHLDALSAKGTFLVKLPSLLGGDPEKGEQLLQQVITQEPKAVNARLALAKVWCEHGRHREAVTLASDALAIAKEQRQTEFIPEATTVLAQVRTNATKAN
jgi:tetratricopeptide (TPR) repeat protein